MLGGNEVAAEGALTIELQSARLPEFDGYFRRLRPATNDRNPWFREVPVVPRGEEPVVPRDDRVVPRSARGSTRRGARGSANARGSASEEPVVPRMPWFRERGTRGSANARGSARRPRGSASTGSARTTAASSWTETPPTSVTTRPRSHTRLVYDYHHTHRRRLPQGNGGDCSWRKTPPRRAPISEQLDPPCDTKLALVQKITFRS